MEMNRKNTLYRMLVMAFISMILSSCGGFKDTSTVMSGKFINSVTEPGELQAVKASFITMPQINWQYGYQFKIIGLVDHGALVHRGDSIIKLDASSVYKFILEMEDRLENELAAENKQAVQ